MADATLHGNHDHCPACELRRDMIDTRKFARPEVPCNVCGGVGYIALSDAMIISRACTEAIRTYWPEFDRRNNLA